MNDMSGNYKRYGVSEETGVLSDGDSSPGADGTDRGDVGDLGIAQK